MLDRGTCDPSFGRYQAVLTEALQEVLNEADLTIVHNIFTMHRNLALTQVLHDLAGQHKFIAWTHDIAGGNSDYALPNPEQAPWSLMRTGHPNVMYIATSELRAGELEKQIPSVHADVIPNPVDPVRLFGLTPEMRSSLPSLNLPARDFIFLLPSSLLPRKNIDFAVAAMKELRAADRDPLLLITAPPSAGVPAVNPYGEFLRKSLPADLSGNIVFVRDFFPVGDAMLRDLYLLADCLFLPSSREGFGLPVAEAAGYRLPIWCQDIPAYQQLAEAEAAYPLTELSQLPAAVEWLESLPTFRQQRLWRTSFDPGRIYESYYAPLLESMVGAESEQQQVAEA
jgi:glycosyltransferase involved in cell wall biosynthesis